MERKTILIISNDSSTLVFLDDKLCLEYETLTAYNSRQALSLLSSKGLKLPDLILCDDMIDNGNGPDFRRGLSKIEHLRHIPLIVLAAGNSISHKRQVLESGAIDFIPIPVDYEELNLKIKAIFSLVENYRSLIVRSEKSLLNLDASWPDSTADTTIKFQRKLSDYQLTNREVEIAKYICDGFSYPGIAGKLFISPKTVAKHVQHIFEKLQVNSKIQLLIKIKSVYF